jgi:hypothetical protein
MSLKSIAIAKPGTLAMLSLQKPKVKISRYTHLKKRSLSIARSIIFGFGSESAVTYWSLILLIWDLRWSGWTAMIDWASQPLNIEILGHLLKFNELKLN